MCFAPSTDDQRSNASPAGILEWLLLAVIFLGLVEIWASFEIGFGVPALLFRVVSALRGGR